MDPGFLEASVNQALRLVHTCPENLGFPLSVVTSGQNACVII